MRFGGCGLRVFIRAINHRATGREPRLENARVSGSEPKGCQEEFNSQRVHIHYHYEIRSQKTIPTMVLGP